MSQISLPVEVWGVPFDLCGRIPGSRLGPAALRLKNVVGTISQLGFPTRSMGDVVPLGYDAPTSYSARTEAALDCYLALREVVEGSLDRGAIPVVLGGDHSLSMGSVSGALAATGQTDLAVLWIDAHMDLNTPSTSPSGNLHGMPLAALTRIPLSGATTERASVVWQRILQDVVPEPGLRPQNIGWLGLRDVDEGEVANYNGFGLDSAWTMQDIDHLGVPHVLQQVDAWLRQTGATNLWISFDVDALDPVLAPGTGTAVRGGLTYREGHLLAELLYELAFQESSPYRIAGVDLVEVNPMEDVGSNTTIAAVEWLGSLFGKRVMGAAR
ncbi:MAG: arginase [Armatimonadetes bacterium]|nr:arginase [Armatimonadota bacterium]MBX3107954.1 arginase [Fimbriimonadaceae bacterium]